MNLPAQNNSPESAQPTVRTSVREVLVPIVVTDKSGRYVTALGRNDFSVFEDGVREKIGDFRRSSVLPLSQPVEPPPGRRAEAVAPNPALKEDPRWTYLIFLDMLHSGFGNFYQVRKALKKFFEEEGAGDSQYALMALGWQLKVVVDSTRDPATVLAAIGSKELQKTVQDSEAANIASDVDRFQRLVGQWCGGCPCQKQMMDVSGMLCPTLKGQVQAAVVSFSARTANPEREFLGFSRFPGQEFYEILKARGISCKI